MTLHFKQTLLLIASLVYIHSSWIMQGALNSIPLDLLKLLYERNRDLSGCVRIRSHSLVY
jgi:hypothetical protein